MQFETEADSTDKSQPFEIKTEDITAVSYTHLTLPTIYSV